MTSVRVIVVHGDSADLAVLASMAAAHGFELRVVEATGDVVAEAVSFAPDAIVIDVKLRAGDGYALCMALKADTRASGVPVILTDTEDGPDAQRRAFAAGCDDFVAKPLSRQLLAYRLRALARLRRAWFTTLDK